MNFVVFQIIHCKRSTMTKIPDFSFLTGASVMKEKNQQKIQETTQLNFFFQNLHNKTTLMIHLPFQK